VQNGTGQPVTKFVAMQAPLPIEIISMNNPTSALLHALCKKKGLTELGLNFAYAENTWQATFNDNNCNIFSCDSGAAFTSPHLFGISMLGYTVSARQCFTINCPEHPDIHGKSMSDLDKLFDKTAIRVRPNFVVLVLGFSGELLRIFYAGCCLASCCIYFMPVYAQLIACLLQKDWLDYLRSRMDSTDGTSPAPVAAVQGDGGAAAASEDDGPAAKKARVAPSSPRKPSHSPAWSNARGC